MNPKYYTENPNNFDLLKWIIFEPNLLEKYGESFSRKQSLVKILSFYFTAVVPLAIGLWLLGALLITGLDLPNLFPELFINSISSGWPVLTGIGAGFLFYLCQTVVGLAIGLAVVLAFVLAFGLTDDLSSVLIIVLAVVLAVGLTVGLTTGLVGGLHGGLDGDLAFFIVGLAFVLAFGLIFGLIFGLEKGLTPGLVAVFVWYVTCFRLYFYPFKFISVFRQEWGLSRNPYLSDAVIWLPLFGIDHNLELDAREEPVKGLEFTRFLLEYRPLQQKFAQKILHAATAGFWLQQSTLGSERIHVEQIAERFVKFRPSAAWYCALDTLKNQLIIFEKQSHLGLQIKAFKNMPGLTRDFRVLHLRETFRGRELYVPAIDHLIQIAEEQLHTLQEKAQNKEPISPNPFSRGEALTPERDSEIFKGREDLKNDLAVEISTARIFPTFLIQGQRRVGKTSLINFLKDILDATRFQIIYQDMESGEYSGSVGDWLVDLRKQFDKTCEFESQPWHPPIDWTAAWVALEHHFEKHCVQKDYRVIVAIDEYECLDKLLAADPPAGERLLKAMRSFMQRQNIVVFLFCGLFTFPDLELPAWNSEFVHLTTFQVDYLEKDAALELIKKPVPEFRLKYEAGLPEHLYEITCGHPQLLQSICARLVTIANSEARSPVTFVDLERVIDTYLMQQGIQPFSVFWTQFCREEKMRATVLKICRHETVSDCPELFRLRDYKFIHKTDDGYRFRAPLFEKWLLRFGY